MNNIILRFKYYFKKIYLFLLICIIFIFLIIFKIFNKKNNNNLNNKNNIKDLENFIKEIKKEQIKNNKTVDKILKDFNSTVFNKKIKERIKK